MRPTSIGRAKTTAVPTVLGVIRTISAVIMLAVVVAVLATVAGVGVGPIGATEEPLEDPSAEDQPIDPEQEALDEQLRTGAEVYSQVCSACHQSGGAGIEGQFPPLQDNPRVDDSAYMAEVINNGLQGEITVGGVLYDGVMPAFSTLGGDDIAAVIAYIQNDFQAPAASIAAFEESGPVAGTELPGLASLSALVAFLLAAGVAALVLAPRLMSANDRLATPWLDAWLKTAVIVLAVVFLTVVIPDWALKTSAVAKLSRVGQDIIGTGLWALGLSIVIGGLWYAHRESRV